MGTISKEQMAVHLAHIANGFEDQPHSAPHPGIEFEQMLFDKTVEQFTWSQVCGPDQFNFGLPITSQTGTNYEFDGAFFDQQELFVIEAKQLKRNLTREHVSIFVMKLVDMCLGAFEELQHIQIHPILVCNSDRVNRAAYLFAISWGVLLISSETPSPYALAAKLRQYPNGEALLATQIADNLYLGNQCWRPFNSLFEHDPRDTSKVILNRNAILGLPKSAMLWEQWTEAFALIAERK